MTAPEGESQADEQRLEFLRQVQLLQETDVLQVGVIASEIIVHWTEHIEGSQEVVLTGKQRLHHLTRHPETAELEAWLVDAVLDPDEVHRNRYDPAIAIFYRRVSPAHHVRVAILMQPLPSTLKHSVLSYRIASRREVERNQVRVVWTKE